MRQMVVEDGVEVVTDMEEAITDRPSLKTPMLVCARWWSSSQTKT
jgi:hypothetical protein